MHRLRLAVSGFTVKPASLIPGRQSRTGPPIDAPLDRSSRFVAPIPARSTVLLPNFSSFEKPFKLQSNDTDYLRKVEVETDLCTYEPVLWSYLEVAAYPRS